MHRSPWLIASPKGRTLAKLEIGETLSCQSARKLTRGDADEKLDYLGDSSCILMKWRMRAVELYINLGKRVRATIRELEYPTNNTLTCWYRE